MNKIKQIIAMLRGQEGPLKYETGLEGCPVESLKVVPCPATAKRVGLLSCHGCNFFVKVKELDRGGKKAPKITVICAAPRSITVETVMLTDASKEPHAEAQRRREG